MHHQAGVHFENFSEVKFRDILLTGTHKEAVLLTKRIFWDCCRNMMYFCGVEKVKHFVNVHLQCIVSNLKRISKTLFLERDPFSAKNQTL